MSWRRITLWRSRGRCNTLIRTDTLVPPVTPPATPAPPTRGGGKCHYGIRVSVLTALQSQMFLRKALPSREPMSSQNRGVLYTVSQLKKVLLKVIPVPTRGGGKCHYGIRVSVLIALQSQMFLRKALPSREPMSSQNRGELYRLTLW